MKNLKQLLEENYIRLKRNIRMMKSVDAKDELSKNNKNIKKIVKVGKI